MNPKDKAKELVEKFKEHTMYWHEVDGWVVNLDSAKACALIVVDEMIEEVHKDFTSDTYSYWQQVKQEIQNL